MCSVCVCEYPAFKPSINLTYNREASYELYASVSHTNFVIYKIL
jgi:hypothetical protein